MLVSWLPELLHHTKKLGIRTSVLSNGMLWSTKRVAQLGDLVDLVNVSLDGASAEIHDEIRGRGSFRQAVRGIQRLGEAGIEVGINICLMKSNARDVVDNLFDLVESFPFHVSVSFAKFVVEGRGLQNAEQSLSGHDLGKVLSELAKQFLGSKWVPTSPSKRLSCGFGKLYAIYANGDVSPCLSPRFIAANITETPIRDVFDQISSNAKGADVDGLPLCRTCDLRYICGGRCHLPQVTQGEAIAQNNCSSSYRRNFYATLARRASIQDEVMLPILNRVI
ncbi:MAG: radical SAM protein [Hyphomicrobiales bacterium]|nr:radical SAM protein [Hyphomicrobiales bacterium]